jgi:pSer/pThr/pTyr-binding forkhead associated (FHA) protein
MMLTDLKSKDGSQLNGRPVVQAILSTGDSLKHGTVSFAIVSAPPVIDSNSG